MTQAPWAEEYFEGAKLEYLAMKNGFFHDGHRAAVNCFTPSGAFLNRHVLYFYLSYEREGPLWFKGSTPLRVATRR